MFRRKKRKRSETKGDKEEKLKELMEKVSKQFAKPDVILVKHALAFIRSRLASRELALIRKAYSFSKKKHGKQKRFSGEPYFTHLIETALILSEYDVDAKTLAAALLHDVLEDTSVQKYELEREFGSEVAELVNALTKVESQSTNSHAYLKKLLCYASKDERVLLVKLADKLHNLRTIEFLPAKKRKAICKQALAFYAPLAEQFGLKKMMMEIQDICFAQLWPRQYKKLKKELEKLYREKDDEITEAIDILKRKLVKKPFGGFVFKKERKNLYHYFKKLKQGKTLEELYDYVSLVIVAGSEDACYEALKAVHNTFYPAPRKFKDYIAVPSGHYKALHTSVIGPRGRPMKVYIRTRETDELEEKGIAYWLKAKKKPRELIKLEALAKTDESEFEEALKSEYLEREITVFDANGKPVFLPRGSTVIDFAFKIDSNSASKTACARVNGKLVPIWHELKPADQVEIVYAKSNQVIGDWLNFAKCYETRQIIRELVEPEQKVIHEKLVIEAIDMFSLAKCFEQALRFGVVKRFVVHQSGGAAKASLELELKDANAEKKLLERLSGIEGVASVMQS
ncbi:MAG: bifunctional (p)ppGpp synthetase/guanosine-3',5'-bis(diphosphate) 3'-pyrophosphohydrolase [Candidatus Diapherotrites archaeon]|nr:bifunctional (p)ppGpp synthetase/guanosine-3',5'-bis(diphosphate) 3'-pyrophosphohydrolase [Candidatus Diapherotrites archaeon]